MLRNWSNPVYSGNLEAACDEIDRLSGSYVERIGLVVTPAAPHGYIPEGALVTLYPIFDVVGHAPAVGEEIECSALGLGSRWRVVRVAQGFPRRWFFAG